MKKRRLINIVVITLFIIIHAIVCYRGKIPDIVGGIVRLAINGDPRELYVVLSEPTYAIGNLIGNAIIIGIFIWVWLKVSKRLFKEK